MRLEIKASVGEVYPAPSDEHESKMHLAFFLDVRSKDYLYRDGICKILKGPGKYKITFESIDG
jgi:hypothetical protein